MDNLDRFLNGEEEDPSTEEIQEFVMKQAEALLRATQSLIKTQIESGYYDVLAESNRAYFDALIEQGFTSDEAMRIVSSSASQAMSQGK